MANESFHNVFHLFSGRTFDDKWSGKANILHFPESYISSALKPFCQITDFDDK